jgi:hypothetical protein
MKKLRLSLAEFRVESFATTAVPQNEGGTVLARLFFEFVETQPNSKCPLCPTPACTVVYPTCPGVGGCVGI